MPLQPCRAHSACSATSLFVFAGLPLRTMDARAHSALQADLELRREIASLIDALRNDPQSENLQSASAFAVVRLLFTQLGFSGAEVRW